MVPAQHIQENPIEFPALRFSEVRTIVQTPEVQRLEKPILQVAYESKPPEVLTVEVQQPYDRVVESVVEVKEQVLAVDSVSNAVYIEKERIIDGLKEIIYKT